VAIGVGVAVAVVAASTAGREPITLNPGLHEQGKAANVHGCFNGASVYGVSLTDASTSHIIETLHFNNDCKRGCLHAWADSIR